MRRFASRRLDRGNERWEGTLDTPLTTYETLDLVFTMSAQLDSIFSYWISASFAVVIGVFVARDHLNLGLAVCIGALYFLASTMFAVRWISAGVLGQEILFAESMPAGYLESIWPLPVLRLITFALGFLITEGYLIYSYAQLRRERTTE